MPTTDVDLMTTKEVAASIGQSVRQTIRLVERHELPVAKKLPGLRGSYLFRRADVQRFITKREDQTRRT